MPWRSGVSTILCSILLLSPHSVFTESPESGTSFPDMGRSWFRYQESVSFLKERGVIRGYPDGSFQPKNPINRAEFLKLVFEAKSSRQPSAAESCFWDVPADAWFASYVCAARRRDIISGYPNGSFHPERTVTFAEALKMLQRTYRGDVPEPDGEKWYEPYVDIFDRTDVLARHSYLPWTPLTRERAADLIVRVLRFDEERIVPNLSPGCGKASVRESTTLTVNGEERSFLLTSPRDYTTHDPYPLIVAFHGRTNSNAQVRAYYGLDRAAKNYFIAYPAALHNTASSFSWSAPSDKQDELKDIAFFDAIVKYLGEQYCIDYDHIYTVGHSLGAWFANSVACIRGDVVRASATVGGDSAFLKSCAGPAAAMIMHNPKDTLSPFSGSERVRAQRVNENSCSDEAVESEPFSLKCVRHRDCYGGNPVVWCPHEQDTDHNGAYYPHTWPDGMGEAIVEFFEELDS